MIRPDQVSIRYTNSDWEEKEETFTGLPARIIQHEYDHIEGILFIDRLSSLKRRLLKGKLSQIAKGKVDVDYVMRFPNKLKL